MLRTEAAFPNNGALGAPDCIAESEWVVMKFGGTSVSTAEKWQTIAALASNRTESGLRVLIVHSAMKGVTNALQGILDETSDSVSEKLIEGIRRQHFELADELGLNGPEILDATLAELEQLAAAVRSEHPTSASLQAKVLSSGEQLSTRLGAAYLNASGPSTTWLDAKDYLTTADQSGQRSYLAANCEYDADPELKKRLSLDAKVLVTQGFVASNGDGETVLLGRGGSDTSAAYFAAKLQARRLEIWTDVPGMFTADPRQIPSAKLLDFLHFDEAQELASTGSAVLHPRCISPLKRHGIPLFIRCTDTPEVQGTQISSIQDDVQPQVKGISVRDELTLISMEGVGMWQEVGFLAAAFDCFSRNGVSVDLISTSESNVTVSIDSANRMFGPTIEKSLIAALSLICSVQVIRDCAAVSIVGCNMGKILSRLGPAFELITHERIHLMCLAANNLNLSFVVDSEQARQLVSKLHAELIDGA